MTEGFGGLVTTSDGTPVKGVKIQIYDSSGKLLATVYTDEDGWYMYNYKWTGKAATFTIKLPAYNLKQSVTLKANAFAFVNFTVP
jgi:5-hydroxyisourate hydrolase-like protein (transthyretin family)